MTFFKEIQILKKAEKKQPLKKNGIFQIIYDTFRK